MGLKNEVRPGVRILPLGPVALGCRRLGLKGALCGFALTQPLFQLLQLIQGKSHEQRVGACFRVGLPKHFQARGAGVRQDQSFLKAAKALILKAHGPKASRSEGGGKQRGIHGSG